MAELKPCPFCGGEAELFTIYLYGKVKSYGIACKKCEMQSGTLKTKQSVIKRWNKRHTAEAKALKLIEDSKFISKEEIEYALKICTDKQNKRVHCEGCHQGDCDG